MRRAKETRTSPNWNRADSRVSPAGMWIRPSLASFRLGSSFPADSMSTATRADPSLLRIGISDPFIATKVLMPYIIYINKFLGIGKESIEDIVEEGRRKK